MFAAAAHARRAILRNFDLIGYEPDPVAWRSIKMGVKRDLQAQLLRPNTPIPPRRNLPRYLRAIHNETGSLAKAIVSSVHDGAWTSSGGSFRLAEELGFDLVSEANQRFESNGILRYLEIGGAWAGLNKTGEGRSRDVAGLARHFDHAIGRRVFLHFTNLTRWHQTLPNGLVEHPFVTAAGLSVLEEQGIRNATVDILYSQAAVYFETDPKSLMNAASALLRNGGLLIFNHQPEYSELLKFRALANGLVQTRQRDLGGMNGIVVAFEKQDAPSVEDRRQSSEGRHAPNLKRRLTEGELR
ncbi:hypothetical protein [Mesorhizobium sp. M0047]|uniref:hypothetical protein n=1 Tax=Mesorhizobium sp. M0047 TaxID=2956859 RepID=UPI0033399366